MKKFQFPLERVMQLRQTQARVEAAKLAELQMEFQDLHKRQNRLWQDLEQERQALLKSPAITGSELAAMERYHDATRARSRELDRQRGECRDRIRHQVSITAQRRREARLLERLKERRLAAWRTAYDKEIQAQAEEAHLARYFGASPVSPF